MSLHFNPLDGTSSKKAITLEELKAVLHYSQTDAAKILKVSSSKLRTTFKKFREDLHLCRWPTKTARESMTKTLCNNTNISIKVEEEEFQTDVDGFPLYNKSLHYKT